MARAHSELETVEPSRHAGASLPLAHEPEARKEQIASAARHLRAGACSFLFAGAACAAVPSPDVDKPGVDVVSPNKEVPSPAVAAQPSSINIYGLISAGVGYVTDEGGVRRRHAVSGTNQNPRLGFRGSEDLGDGLRGVFTLEMGFNVMTGALSQNGRGFGRQAFVGLSDKRWGALTFGRQYDTVHDYLGPVLIASNGVAIGDNDNAYNNIRIQNSIKYISPSIAGINFTGVYGLSESASQSDNNAYSVGLGYSNKGWNGGIVYARMNNPNSLTSPNGAIGNDYASGLLIFNRSAQRPNAGVSKQTVSGIGTLYTTGPAVLGAYFSNVEFDYLDSSGLTLRNYNVSINYSVRPQIILGVALMQTNGDYSVTGKQPKWSQLNLQFDYVLSKRSDLFANVIYQRATGDATAANIFGFNASSGREQTLLTLGVRHRF